MNPRFRPFFFMMLVGLLMAIAVPTWGQYGASVQGTVQDPQGAVVPHAKVTLKATSTGRNYTTQTTGDGFYRISELPPGDYSLQVSATGFKTSTTQNIVVKAEAIQQVNVSLQIGTAEQSVTVTAAASQLQTANGSISTTLTSQEIDRLPLTGRDPYEAVRLAPGIFGDGARSGSDQSVGFPNGPGSNNGSGGPGGSNTAIFQTENQQPISAGGQRITANDYSVDGVSVNSLTWGGAAVLTPSEESVQEITVLSNDYDAEDGRNAGAHVKVVTKSGTNQFHGDGFFKYQSPGLNAFNKYCGFNAGVSFAPDCRVENKFRQFGGSLGGPVLRDRLFFFFGYEGLRSHNTTFSDQFVDTADLRALFGTARSGTATATVLSQPGVAPRIQQVLTPSCALWTAASLPCQVVGNEIDIGSPAGSYGTYVASFGSSAQPAGNGLDTVGDLQSAEIFLPSSISGNQYNARADYDMGKNRFSVSTFLTPFNETAADGAAQGRPMADFTSKRFSPSGFLSWVSTINATMVNEARFNFTRFGFNELKSNPNVNFGIPRIEVQGLPLPGGQRIRWGEPQSGTQPGIFAQNTFAFSDKFSQVFRSHALKYGFDYTHEQNNDNPIGGARPVFVFQGLWNFANGTPIFESNAVDPRTGAPTGDQRYFHTSNYGFYVQDDWQFRPNLTFNMGLRYDYFTPMTEAHGQLTNFILGPGTSGLSAGAIQFVKQMTKPDRNNFGPRLGFAWSPSILKNKMVWRGGFGVNYDRIDDVMFINSGQNPPAYALFNSCCGTNGTTDGFGSPFDGGNILYALGSSNSPLSYPTNPVLGGGIDPTNNLPTACCATVWGDPQNMPNPYVYSYSLETQYLMPSNWLASIGYQGSSSHKLVRIKNLFFFYPSTAPNVGAVFFPTPDTTANFNSLDTRLEHRFAGGYQTVFEYRYSKSLDELSSEGPGFVTNQTFPTNLATEYGPSDFDATHYFRIYGLWDLPLFRGRTDLVGKTLGGWELNGIFTFHSGFPWTPVTFSSCFTVGANNLCPVRPTSYLGGAGNQHNTEAFLPPTAANFSKGGTAYFTEVAPAPGVIPLPGIGRNSFRGPRYSGIDFSLVKQFGLPQIPGIGENSKLAFRANFYNAFNKLNLAPFTFGSASTDINNPQFGTATTGLAGRVIEFQTRFDF